MENQKIMYGVGGLVLGGILMFLFVGSEAQKDSSLKNQGMMEKKTETAVVKEDSEKNEGMSMTAMNDALKNKTGDDFDKAFIELMTEHHQGAIDMANLIETRAKHQEIKALGKNIITAQTKEIKEMADWAKVWGYTTEDGGNMMMQKTNTGGGMMH
ncbi:MAG: DUF305 domain-containing protein [Candidatus Moranbacteria bacterium]|nr:DUF305 domain-containing protein [Candidatus Moranbacteria bacterium]